MAYLFVLSGALWLAGSKQQHRIYDCMCVGDCQLAGKVPAKLAAVGVPVNMTRALPQVVWVARPHGALRC
jgi:hypothetical protein